MKAELRHGRDARPVDPNLPAECLRCDMGQHGHEVGCLFYFAQRDEPLVAAELLQEIMERLLVIRRVQEPFAQHAEMKVDGEALAREFEDVVDGTILARSEVEALGRRYIDGFRAHMKCEDDEVIPLAGTVLTDQDWHTINAAIAHVEDPMFGVGAERRYAALREHIARESRGPTLE